MKTILLLALSVSLLPAQDVIFLRSGESRAGRVTAAGPNLFLLEVPLPPRPGSPAAFASVSVPKSQVSSIEFARDPALEGLLESSAPGDLPAIATLWAAQLVCLDVPKSPAARIGCHYGDLLLRSGSPENARAAREVFQRVESEAWNDGDRMAARHGRLRAMLATGNAKDAADEAAGLAAITEDPAVLIEAKFLLAEAAASSLKTLLHDNPRWQEDPGVVPERNRLYHEALDLFLYPSLFEGAAAAAAARGLWGAIGVYQLAGELPNALECARDISIIHPGTEYAGPADALLAKLQTTRPPSHAEKPEEEAPPQNVPPPEKPKKKNHENKKPKKS